MKKTIPTKKLDQLKKNKNKRKIYICITGPLAHYWQAKQREKKQEEKTESVIDHYLLLTEKMKIKNTIGLLLSTKLASGTLLLNKNKKK